ncbi:MAG TPA: hypothetical protein VEY11_16240 [Pyrinomonadaceae bacterium]|nr:hypothetical protein [Pyrinomonadaceae bacterium]
MGITYCESHGRQHLKFVCLHLHDAIRERRVIDGWAKVGVEFDGVLGYYCRYCFDCADRFKMPRVGFIIEVSEEGEEEFLFGEEIPVCGACFRQATENVAGFD